MTDEAMSPLRRRMIEDMTIRKLAQSGTLLRLSADRPTRRAWRTCDAFNCILPRTARIRPFSITRCLRYGSSSGSRLGATTSSSTRRSSISRASCQWCSARRKWRGCSMLRPGSNTRRQRGLWRGPARRRGHLAQGLRHRQQADDHPRGAGQRPQGPLRDAFAEPARCAHGGGRHGPRAGCFQAATPYSHVGSEEARSIALALTCR